MTAKRDMMRTIPTTTVGRTTSESELRPVDVGSTVITLTSGLLRPLSCSGLQSVNVVADDLCKALSRAAIAA